MADINQTFLGTGWGFPPTFDKASGGVEMVADETDVAQAIEVLINTAPGERLFRPNFGTDMRKLIFEPINKPLLIYMSELIKDSIHANEPRVVVNTVNLEVFAEEGLIEISVDFTVLATNSTRNLVYPYYTNEAAQ